MTARFMNTALGKGESGKPRLVSIFLATAGHICTGAGRAWKIRNKEFIQVSPNNITPPPPGFECKLRDGFHISEFIEKDLDGWLITGFFFFFWYS